MKKIVLVALICMFFLISVGCGDEKKPSQAEVKKETEVTKDTMVKNLISMKESGKSISEILLELSELSKVDARLGNNLEKLFEYWDKTESSYFVDYEISSDYAKDESLCIVILGFKLQDDGSPEDELIERLKVGLDAAKTYPRAKVLVTGGGTALHNKTTSEAQVMADWLVENGLDEDRLIVEKASLTTVENAIFSVNILKQYFPEIKELVIVTSDYHVGLGSLLFEGKIALDYDLNNISTPEVVGNVAYMQHQYKPFSRITCASCLNELYMKNIKE